MIKWIGQHIVDFIARFRSDVYLEDIADGTVADNKFLGLDSNNKIVKEAASATVTDLHSAGVDGSANQLLTDDGDGTITSESTLTYNSEILSIGADDAGVAEIIRTPHSDGAGGELRIKGGGATAGQTDQAGSKLRLFGGQGTGTGVGGHVEIKTAPAAGSTGTTLNALSHTWEFADDGNLTVPGDIVGPTDGDLNIKSDGGVFFTLDTDTDESNQMFTIAETSGEGSFEYNAGRSALDMISSLSGYPSLRLTATTDDALSSGSFTFTKKRTDSSIQAGEDNDVIGGHIYSSYNDAGTPEVITYAYTHAAIKDASDTDEAGKYTIQVATSDGSTSALQNAFSANGHGTNNIVSTTIGHGAASVVTVPGVLSALSGITFDGVALTTLQTSAESFADNDTSLMTSAAIDDRINAAGGGADEVVSTGDHILKQTKVTIDTAGFNGLNSTPVELVAAQGANKVIVPTEVVLFHDRASNQTNSIDLIVGFNGLTSYPTAVKYIRRYMQNITTDRTMTMGDYARNYANDLTTAVNSNLTIATSGAPTTNCVTSLTVYTSYYVIDIS